MLFLPPLPNGRSMHKYTKQQAGYEPVAQGHDHCDDCQSFLKNGDCAKIEGKVAPKGWCQFYDEKPLVTIRKSKREHEKA
jgi:hypothetical protein